MVAAQARQSRYADQDRRDVSFKVGDLVMVHRDFLITPAARDQTCVKLRPRWFGPYKVVAAVLPLHIKYNYQLIVVHILCFMYLLFSIILRNKFPNRVADPPPPFTDKEGHKRYIVEKVISQRLRRGKRHFLVKWQGYVEPTWEPEEFLLDEDGNAIVPLKEFLESWFCFFFLCWMEVAGCNSYHLVSSSVTLLCYVSHIRCDASLFTSVFLLYNAVECFSGLLLIQSNFCCYNGSPVCWGRDGQGEDFNGSSADGSSEDAGNTDNAEQAMNADPVPRVRARHPPAWTKDYHMQWSWTYPVADPGSQQGGSTLLTFEPPPPTPVWSK